MSDLTFIRRYHHDMSKLLDNPNVNHLQSTCIYLPHIFIWIFCLPQCIQRIERGLVTKGVFFNTLLSNSAEQSVPQNSFRGVRRFSSFLYKSKCFIFNFSSQSPLAPKWGAGERTLCNMMLLWTRMNEQVMSWIIFFLLYFEYLTTPPLHWPAKTKKLHNSSPPQRKHSLNFFKSYSYRSTVIGAAVEMNYFFFAKMFLPYWHKINSQQSRSALSSSAKVRC